MRNARQLILSACPNFYEYFLSTSSVSRTLCYDSYYAMLRIYDYLIPRLKFAAAKKEKMMREKFDKLKSEGKLGQYMAKKRKHNAQRDRKYLPQKPQ